MNTDWTTLLNERFTAVTNGWLRTFGCMTPFECQFQGHKYEAVNPDVSFLITPHTVRVETSTWIATILLDFVTEKPRAYIVGDPEGALILADHCQDQPIADEIRREVSVRRDPYRRLYLPGERKSEKARVAPGQTEIGDHVGRPVFGQTLPKKSRRKK